ncbi:MAG: methyltransferase domain-containing protein [Marinobacterium sp.]|nr:methyltransferase domain-containing protein [Marinobacterium sp.]
MTEQTLACPVCRAALIRTDNNLRCSAGHSFDRARQGYWNLLLAHKKRSKDPGDNATMVQARHNFLEQGYYQRLSDAVNKMAVSALNGNLEAVHQPKVTDMGCGEGYYTERLHSSLVENLTCNQLRENYPQPCPPTVSALDISRHAIKAACRRTKAIQWIVASGADMPLADDSQDLLCVLFSRLMPDAFARVLKPGAHLLIAWPGENHLIELRKEIYDEVRPSRFDPITQLNEQFKAIEQQQIRYPFTLQSQEDIQALLGMTPHSQRMASDRRARLNALNSLPLTLDVNLALLRKRKPLCNR